MPDLNELNDQIGKLLESKENEIIYHRIKWAVEENMPSDDELNQLATNIINADNKIRRKDILTNFLGKLLGTTDNGQ